MSAWLLVLWGGGMMGGPLVIPAISSEAECERLKIEVHRADSDIWGRKCIEYRIATKDTK